MVEAMGGKMKLSDLRDAIMETANDHAVWCRPRFHVYKPADTRFRAALNRYPHGIVGAAIVVFRRCWCIQWKASPLRDRPDKEDV